MERRVFIMYVTYFIETIEENIWYFTSFSNELELYNKVLFFYLFYLIGFSNTYKSSSKLVSLSTTSFVASPIA